MDFSTLLGILSGIGMIILAIITKNSLLVFFDLPSLLIVLGGTTASTLTSFSFQNMLWALRDIYETFMSHNVKIPPGTDVVY